MEMLRKIPLAMALTLGLATAAHATATLKLLKSFCSEASCTDGETPSGTTITDSSHNIYGTTQSGGAHGGGVAYQLLFNPDTQGYRYRKLYDFCVLSACADGATPTNARLVIDTNGTLYGTAAAGGGSNNGVVFELVPNQTKTHYHFIKLYEFCVEFSACQDGAQPTGGLTFAGQDQGQTYDGKAALYGTTQLGASDDNGGLAFSFVPPPAGQDTGTMRQLYKFCHLHDVHHFCTDGAHPGGNITIDKNGHLWGTTSAGGGNATNQGLIYELTPSVSGSWANSTVYAFCALTACADGAAPTTGLAVDSNGNFYGTTSTGGLAYRKCADTGCGILFKLTSSGATETTLYSFCKLAKCADGGMPEGLVLDPNNNIYGANNIGGLKHNGNFFKLNGTTMTDMYDIKCVNNVCSNGINPTGSLMLDANDDLFGGFMNAGRNGQGGELFKLSE